MTRFVHPIPGYSPRGSYGNRPGFWENGKWIPPMFHEGEDFSAPAGTPIRAAHDGRVVSSYHDVTGGWMVTIQSHDGVYRSRYLHMQAKSPVAVGQNVKAGQIIGRVGSTGLWTTGPHLHYEVWKNGRVVDPKPYLNRSTSTGKGYKIMAHRLFKDRRARSIRPGQRLWLGKGSAKTDVAPSVGQNMFIVHAGVKGLKPGDSIEIKMAWVNRNGKGTYSWHYKHRAVVSRDGVVRINVPFTRSVVRGTFVYVSIWAAGNNQATGTVEWLDCDNLLLG